jgi:hypothetical protein
MSHSPEEEGKSPEKHVTWCAESWAEGRTGWGWAAAEAEAPGNANS